MPYLSPVTKPSDLHLTRFALKTATTDSVPPYDFTRRFSNSFCGEGKNDPMPEFYIPSRVWIEHKGAGDLRGGRARDKMDSR